MIKLFLLFFLQIYSPDATAMFDEIMSPYCPGRTLSACPSEDARKLRTDIEGWFQAGDSKEEVLRKLEGSFGKEITGEGSSSALGAGALFLLIPAIIIFLVYKFQYKKDVTENETENESERGKKL
jgi:cytochrome c-type biogenesis protein CcmH/NrfF